MALRSRLEVSEGGKIEDCATGFQGCTMLECSTQFERVAGIQPAGYRDSAAEIWTQAVCRYDAIVTLFSIPKKGDPLRVQGSQLEHCSDPSNLT